MPLTDNARLKNSFASKIHPYLWERLFKPHLTDRQLGFMKGSLGEIVALEKIEGLNKEEMQSYLTCILSRDIREDDFEKILEILYKFEIKLNFTEILEVALLTNGHFANYFLWLVLSLKIKHFKRRI